MAKHTPPLYEILIFFSTPALHEPPRHEEELAGYEEQIKSREDPEEHAQNIKETTQQNS